MTRHKLKVTLIGWALSLGLMSALSGGLSADALPPTRISQRPPAPPTTPPPNATRSGGSLSGSAGCNGVNQPLLALVPTENPVLTASAYPTFLFYVPYRSSDVRYGEFSVLAGLDESQRVYRVRFVLPENPGVVSVSLPASASAAIAQDVPHHWYFKLYCQNSRSTTADLSVDGWVQRVAETPERDRQINAATPEIWYDSLAQLSDRLRQSPQDRTLRDRWRALLSTIELETLAQEPLVGSVRAIAE